MKVCVVCASNYPLNPLHREHAQELGKRLVSVGASLVYGGGKNGLMKEIAEPFYLRGQTILALTTPEYPEEQFDSAEVIACENFQHRVRRMSDISDCFVALTGGSGTREEIQTFIARYLETRNEKPVALLNTAGFYDGWLLQHQRDHSEGVRRLPKLPFVAKEPEQVVAYFMEKLRNNGDRDV